MPPVHKSPRRARDKDPFILYTYSTRTELYKLEQPYIIQTRINNVGGSYEEITLDDDGRLTLAKGFMWNGVTGFPDLDSMMRGSCVHDALYVLLHSNRSHLDRATHKRALDRLMRRIFVEDGCPRPIADGAYWVVYNFSHFVERKPAETR